MAKCHDADLRPSSKMATALIGWSLYKVHRVATRFEG